MILYDIAKLVFVQLFSRFNKIILVNNLKNFIKAVMNTINQTTTRPSN